ncbi:hypothetical protein C1646_698465 [Rhizophagus diaphanus]|nr:hypothetical protein C1646_698465 [Rhizophagus diaphanus] [Rhizophagus sp. MUCL 43196]
MEQNFNLIYRTSFENDSFLKLQDFCTELISKEPEKIFNSVDFISLSEKSLISLIQHDNVQKNVIQVWEHVLKWGIAQNSELSSDPSGYSKDGFIALKNTLQQFIPFINFFNFTSKEYLDKVYPYKKQSNNPEPKITTKETSSKGIDSKIITIQHAELISKWIDRLEITDKMKNSYEFKLILRGSRDGFSSQKFHEICDNQSHTITIIKVKNSNEILGGYNPIIWKSDLSYGITKDSFIFSFKDKEIIENYILSRVKYENFAIYNDSGFGPCFGDGDLFLLSGENYDQGCSYIEWYDKLIRETEGYFFVEDYEIFQIIRLINISND